VYHLPAIYLLRAKGVSSIPHLLAAVLPAAMRCPHRPEFIRYLGGMRLALLALVLLPVFTACQRNFLHYKYKPFFSERNWIRTDRRDTLVQIITYNRPGVIDEEYNYDLNIFFLDTALAKQKRFLDLGVDTTIVKIDPLFSSVWVWDAGMDHLDGKSYGTIKIKKWDNDGIRLKENIKVYDPEAKKKRKFKGVRTFRR
jgi:hypothetical protein